MVCEAAGGEAAARAHLLDRRRRAARCGMLVAASLLRVLERSLTRARVHARACTKPTTHTPWTHAR
eukprot:1386831-Pleurochrysis_carterae.AAC.1